MANPNSSCFSSETAENSFSITFSLDPESFLHEEARLPRWDAVYQLQYCLLKFLTTTLN